MESLKTCYVEYGECQNLSRTSRGDTDTDNSIKLDLDLSGLTEPYCYTVTASDGTHTVIVEGETSKLAARKTT